MGCGMVVAGGAVDRFGGGQDEPTGFDPFSADELLGEVADLLNGAPEQDHFEASTRIQVDVRGRHNTVQVMVLDLGEPVGDPRSVVVIDQGHHAHRWGLIVGDGLVD